MIGETGERKSAVATPDGKSRKKKKNVCWLHLTEIGVSVCSITACGSPLTISLLGICQEKCHSAYLLSSPRMELVYD